MRCKNIFFRPTLLSLLIGYFSLQQVIAKDEFDSDFLRHSEDDKNIDISRFNHKNGVLAGQYPADVYVNGKNKGNLSLTFAEQNKQVVLCLTPDLVNLLDLKKDAYTQPLEGDCVAAEKTLKGNFSFDTSLLKLEVNLPQALTIQHPRDYIPSTLWEEGVAAAFVNYDVDNYHYQSQGSRFEQTYLGIRAGANLGSLALRHRGSQYFFKEKDSLGKETSEKSHYSSSETYLQKDFATIRGLVTLGDFFTTSPINENMALRGIQVASDDRMLPASQRGYAPVIQGVANTNASVTIRQNGVVIYQTTVPAGAFVISDLYPSGSSGDLSVEIMEANGQKRIFIVPYASVAPLIRFGQFRYHMSAGRYRYGKDIYPDRVAQFSLQYGLLNNLTLNSGLVLHKNYQSALVGAGFNTPIGAFSTDATFAKTTFSNSNQTKRGYSLHANYSVNLLSTNTNLTLAAYRYSSKDFYTLRDTIWANHSDFIDDESIQYIENFRPKNQYQISINQSLGETLGSLYLIGSTYRYWNKTGARNEYQLAYNNNYKSVSYQFGFSQSIDLDTKNRENSVYLSLSIPFGEGNASLSTSMTHSKEQNSVQTTFSDAIGEYNQFNYSLSASTNDRRERTLSVNAYYRNNFAEYRSTISQDQDKNLQYSLGLSGSIVAHPHGITLGNSVSDSFMIIHAKDAAGALVTNTGQGQTLDYFGNAIVPYSTPYSINYAGIDPKNLPINVEFSATEKQVIPRANSISVVNFDSRINTMVLFKLRDQDGLILPMSAEAKDDVGNIVGYIAQGGILFANNLSKEKGKITVMWGMDSKAQCHFDYVVKLDKKSTEMKQIDAICHR